MNTQTKQRLKQLRRWRIRKKVTGTAERPRMAVNFSGQHIYVQFIDDTRGTTLVSTSTLGKGVDRKGNKGFANVANATTLGAAAAALALEKKIQQVVFDRGGAQYHGKVKALADAARSGGLKF